MENNGHTLTPKNWTKFQHYHDRNPTWIKLQVSLLDDPDFMELPAPSQLLCILLWLMASKYHEGVITACNEKIAWRLRMPIKELEKNLDAILSAGYFISSNGLATPEQVASLETEKSRDREEIEWCEKIYFEYPRKVAKPEAIKAIRRRVREVGGVVLFAKTKAFASVRPDKNDRFTPHPATWFNQERYNDDPETWKDAEPNRRLTPKDIEKQKQTDSLARLAKAQEQLHGSGSI